MRATHAEALEHGADGIESRWENPETGNNGSITPLNTTDDRNGVCRQAHIVNHSGNTTGDATYRFCRQADGSWMVQRQRNEPPDQLPLHEQEQP